MNFLISVLQIIQNLYCQVFAALKFMVESQTKCKRNLLSADECCVSAPGMKELAGTEDDDI